MTAKRVSYDTKRAAVLAWFRDGRQREDVDVVSADFVNHYLERTGVSCYPMPYGAHKCPDLGRTLARMERTGDLDRHRTGLRGMGGMGFPRWVWSYRIRDVGVLL